VSAADRGDLPAVPRGLPRGAVTGVGSLPYRDAREAVELVRWACPAVPFWPQLPNRSRDEGMVAQFLEPAASLLETADGVRYAAHRGARTRLLDALAGSTGGLPRDRAAGFHAFRDALDAGGFPNAIAIKGQVTGPLTLAACLETDSGSPLARDPAALAVLADHVARQACWQVRELSRGGAPVLVTVDEPCLALADGISLGMEHALGMLAGIFARIRACGGRAGLHCCAPVAPARFCEAGPDVISFDAHQALETFVEDDAVRAFVDGGGWLATGLVPTRADPAGVSASALFARWLVAACDGRDCTRLARQTLVTASCGLGLLLPAAARGSFRVADRLAARLRRVANGS